MNNNFNQEYSPEIQEKVKKNLVYVGIFSVIMLFAGFTSAYIVSMGDSFWLKFPLPSAFWISTAVIILSSIFFELGIRSIKKENASRLKLFMALALLSGMSFVYFQFKGYGQLTDFGAHAVNNHIIVTDGRYGDHFEIKYKENFIEVDGNKYLVEGREMTSVEFAQLQTFMKQFEKADPKKAPVVNQYGKPFVIYRSNEPVGLIDGKLVSADGTAFEYVDHLRLSQLAVNIGDSRGDFFVKGEYGKDFKLYFKGQELEYVNRELRKDGQKLDKYLQIRAMDTADTATSYLYIITFLHLLHILVALIYLVRVTIFSFSGRFSSTNTISLRAGAIFWHFLGLLWIYLLLFLLFIH
jgi:cytochrome c oxidase subunit 3